jgi:hypothetical protein
MFKFSLRFVIALTVLLSVYSSVTAQTVAFDVTRISGISRRLLEK